MMDRTWKVYIGLVLISILFLPIAWQWTTGWLLGSLVSYVIFRRIETFTNRALSLQSSSGTYGNFALNYLLMAASLLICAFLPQFFNILTCAFGLTTIKLAIIIDSFIKERGR